MNWFKNIFGLKGDIQVKDGSNSNVEQGHSSESLTSPSLDKMCEFCQEPITNGQKYKHFKNKIYHVKPCFRKMIKMAKRELFG